jgi:hypothetical protein
VVLPVSMNVNYFYELKTEKFFLKTFFSSA